MSSSHLFPLGAGGDAPLAPIPAYTLFDADAVVLATFLGGPLAGSILIAVNYRRLGMGRNGAPILAVGLFVTALALGFGSLMPAAASAVVGFGLLLVARSVAKALQGTAVEEHVRNGGYLGSKWAAAGLGIVLLAIMVGGYWLATSGPRA